MQHTKSDIFWKCWLWSCICGIIVAILFWFTTSLTDVFHWNYGGAAFIDLLIISSIAGAYFGAGYVGSRIAHKYYGDHDGVFVKRYLRYSLITFVVFVVIAYSPLSFLSLLWSFIAPYCVLKTLDYLKPPVKKKHVKHTQHI
jgi:hypothetical protein